jgi:hypothetical protein
MCTLLVMQVNTGTDWAKPSARLWRLRLTEVAVLGGFAAVAVGVAAGIGAGSGIGLAGALASLAAAGVAAFYLRNRYRSWAYRERAEDLIVARGVLVRRVSVVPYGSACSGLPPSSCTRRRRRAMRGYPGWSERRQLGCGIVSPCSARPRPRACE